MHDNRRQYDNLSAFARRDSIWIVLKKMTTILLEIEIAEETVWECRLKPRRSLVVSKVNHAIKSHPGEEMNAAWLYSFFCFGILDSSSGDEKGLGWEKNEKENHLEVGEEEWLQ